MKVVLALALKDLRLLDAAPRRLLLRRGVADRAGRSLRGDLRRAARGALAAGRRARGRGRDGRLARLRGSGSAERRARRGDREPDRGRGDGAAGQANRVGGLALRASARRPANPFGGQAPPVEIGIDPTRKAEAAMLEGLLAREAAEGLQERLSDREASRRMVADALSRLRYAPPWSPEKKRNERFLGGARPVAGGGTGRRRGRREAPAAGRRARRRRPPTGAAPGARSSSRSRRACCGVSWPAPRTSRSGSSGSARAGRWGGC